MFLYNGIITYIVLEAQLLSNYIDVTDSLSHSLAGRLSVLAISPLFVNILRRSLRFCHLEFDERDITDGFMAHYPVFRESVVF